MIVFIFLVIKLNFYFHLSQDGETSREDSSAHNSSKILSKLSNGNGNGNISSVGNPQPAVSQQNASFNSPQLLAQRKSFAESQIGRSSFHKLLEPSSSQRPGIAPYRIVLGDVKEKVSFSIWTTHYVMF